MTFPAFHFLEQLMSMLDALYCHRSLRRNCDGFAWLLCFPALGESLDVGNQILPVFVAQWAPRWHVAGLHTSHQRPDKIGIQRQSSSRCGAAFERRRSEVAGLRIEKC